MCLEPSIINRFLGSRNEACFPLQTPTQNPLPAQLHLVQFGSSELLLWRGVSLVAVLQVGPRCAHGPTRPW